MTVGEYEDGRPGEVFLKVAKQGSTLAGIMDAFAISVSHGLQYGVPLEAFVDMFTNMRFEPAGMTDDPDIRFATSLVDYIFRRLAVEYLDLDKRRDLGILTVDERSAADAAGRGGGDDGHPGRLRPAAARGPRPVARHHRDAARASRAAGRRGAQDRGRGRALLRLRRHHAAGRQLPRLPELRRDQRLLLMLSVKQ